MEYFSHDINARNSPKITRLRMRLGAEGYGLYFMLLELLAQSDKHELGTDYEQVAFSLQLFREEDAGKLQYVVEESGLFDVSDGKFRSPGMIERLKVYENIREKRVAAGKASGEARRKMTEQKTNMCSASDEQKLNTCGTKSNKLNEIKLNNNITPSFGGVERGENFLSADLKNEKNELQAWVDSLDDASDHEKAEIERLTDGWNEESVGGKYLLKCKKENPESWRAWVEKLHECESKRTLTVGVSYDEWFVDEVVERSDMTRYFKKKILSMLGERSSEIRGVCLDALNVSRNPKSQIRSVGSYVVSRMEAARKLQDGSCQCLGY